MRYLRSSLLLPLAGLWLCGAVMHAEAASAQSHDFYVKGHVRSDGSYVQPHYQSAPDGNPYNNYSFPGNVNPHTGKVAQGNPDTYLRNYEGVGRGLYHTWPGYQAK
jgi:hypothetical protein